MLEAAVTVWWSRLLLCLGACGSPVGYDAAGVYVPVGLRCFAGLDVDVAF